MYARYIVCRHCNCLVSAAYDVHAFLIFFPWKQQFGNHFEYSTTASALETSDVQDEPRPAVAPGPFVSYGDYHAYSSSYNGLLQLADLCPYDGSSLDKEMS